MNLYTRCPKCETTFRVTTQQLQASSGQVRCGQCQNIFDAFATLTAQEPRPERMEPVASVITPQAAPYAVAPARAVESNRAQPARSDPAASLYEWEFKMPEARRHTALWSTLAFVLVLLIAVQVGYVFRTEIMVIVPQARSHYARFCESAGCTIGLPRLSGYLHISASDL
ncbi:unnamed protein product, partial [Phaeothamnion confervicola]